MSDRSLIRAAGFGVLALFAIVIHDSAKALDLALPIPTIFKFEELKGEDNNYVIATAFPAIRSRLELTPLIKEQWERIHSGTTPDVCEYIGTKGQYKGRMLCVLKKK